MGIINIVYVSPFYVDSIIIEIGPNIYSAAIDVDLHYDRFAKLRHMKVGGPIAFMANMAFGEPCTGDVSDNVQTIMDAPEFESTLLNISQANGAGD